MSGIISNKLLETCAKALYEHQYKNSKWDKVTPLDRSITIQQVKVVISAYNTWRYIEIKESK